VWRLRGIGVLDVVMKCIRGFTGTNRPFISISTYIIPSLNPRYSLLFQNSPLTLNYIRLTGTERTYTLGPWNHIEAYLLSTAGLLFAPCPHYLGWGGHTPI